MIFFPNPTNGSNFSNTSVKKPKKKHLNNSQLQNFVSDVKKTKKWHELKKKNSVHRH